MAADEKRPRWKRRGYAAALLLLVLLLAGFSFLRVGSWLVVSEEPVPSAAIVVLSGEVPFRAMEGADLYNQGWAPEVWLTLGRDARRDAAAAPLGVDLFIDADDNRHILEALGVPPDAIHEIPGAVRNTADEVREISKRLSETGGERVILVSSKFHTRRVRTLWTRLTGNPAGAIVQPATRDPYDGSRWWRSSNSIGYVAKELLGLVNAWIGSRVEPW